MAPVSIMSISQKLRRVRQTNTTDASFPARAPTMTKPNGNGNNVAQTTSAIIDMGGSGFTQNSAKILPFGVGIDGDTFSMRVYAWCLAEELGVTSKGLWIPVKLCELAVALTDSMPGVDGSLIDSTNLFADTITITGTTAIAGVHINVLDPADDTIAHVVLDIEAPHLLEVTFETGSVATSCNALIALF